MNEDNGIEKLSKATEYNIKQLLVALTIDYDIHYSSVIRRHDSNKYKDSTKKLLFHEDWSVFKHDLDEILQENGQTPIKYR